MNLANYDGMKSKTLCFTCSPLYQQNRIWSNMYIWKTANPISEENYLLQSYNLLSKSTKSVGFIIGFHEIQDQELDKLFGVQAF